MRINQFIARSTGMSRRAADQAIADGRVQVNNQPASAGQQVEEADQVVLDGQNLSVTPAKTIILNKPTGYLVSRAEQGAPTVYDLLPPEMAELKPAGRLDKDSSGLLVMSNDGQVIHTLSHPSKSKWKIYQVTLDKALPESDRVKLQSGVELEDGISRLKIEPAKDHLIVRLQEGRNRQIRRSFAALGYKVKTLHRIAMGDLELSNLESGKFKEIKL